MSQKFHEYITRIERLTVSNSGRNLMGNQRFALPRQEQEQQELLDVEDNERDSLPILSIVEDEAREEDDSDRFSIVSISTCDSDIDLQTNDLFDSNIFDLGDDSSNKALLLSSSCSTINGDKNNELMVRMIPIFAQMACSASKAIYQDDVCRERIFEVTMPYINAFEQILKQQQQQLHSCGSQKKKTRGINLLLNLKLLILKMKDAMASWFAPVSASTRSENSTTTTTTTAEAPGNAPNGSSMKGKFLQFTIANAIPIIGMTLVIGWLCYDLILCKYAPHLCPAFEDMQSESLCSVGIGKLAAQLE